MYSIGCVASIRSDWAAKGREHPVLGGTLDLYCLNTASWPVSRELERICHCVLISDIPVESVFFGLERVAGRAHKLVGLVNCLSFYLNLIS